MGSFAGITAGGAGYGVSRLLAEHLHAEGEAPSAVAVTTSAHSLRKSLGERVQNYIRQPCLLTSSYSSLRQTSYHVKSRAVIKNTNSGALHCDSCHVNCQGYSRNNFYLIIFKICCTVRLVHKRRD